MTQQGAALAATFADYRTVKSRKVLQLILEIPIEKQAEAFLVLGFPMPDNPPWVAVAKLDPKLMQPNSTGPKNEAASERAKAEYRFKPPAEQAVVRAARLCTELRFQQWLEPHCAAKGITSSAQPGEESTADLLRRCIGVKSRAEIASDPAACQRFLSIETAYKEAHGMMAEQRR